MYEYPIYKNLVQFSNMVDSNGHLLKGAAANNGSQ